MIRILIVDDRQLLRESLAQVLGERERLAVVAMASDVPSALAMVKDFVPDVMVLGMRMSGSTELLQHVSATFENTRIVALGGTCDETGVTVLRDGSIDDLVTAIHQASHTTTGDPEVVAPIRLEGSRLTPREQAVVRLIDQGFSNKEIAHELHIAVSTVKSHVHRILDKLQVSDRGDVAAAVRRPSA